ncbi:MAG: glycine zipper 2TM domain-containing protein [Thiobacillaceae bacterium]
MRNAILLALLMTGASLAHAERHYPQDQDCAQPGSVSYPDVARVMSSSPITQQVNRPRQECWTEEVTSMQNQVGDHSYAGAIIGGLAGGILGHTVGGGTGKDASTAVGAVTGAIVGDNLDNQGNGNPSPQTRQEQHCRTVDNWTQQITGYTVIYRYQGREFRSVLPYDPGRELQLSVSIMPALIQPVDRYSPLPGSYAPPPPPDRYPVR